MLILDENATPFSRIWCDYELYSAVMNPSMELDIAATIQGEQQEEARILSKNVIPGESAVAKSAREQDFPIFLLDRGLQVCLEKGAGIGCFLIFRSLFFAGLFGHGALFALLI